MPERPSAGRRVRPARPTAPAGPTPAREVEAAAGRLTLCATPVGNLEDITLRALRCLREADVVFAEDTRRTRGLLTHFGISVPLRACHAHNEAERAVEAVARVRSGQHVVVVTDAGTPGLSDPGHRLVTAAAVAGVALTALPGASALLPALVLSGLPTDGFCFLGFLPRRPGQRRKALAAGLALPLTVAVYEAPHRLGETLAEAAAIAPARPAAVARELTKIHEEVARGTLADLAARWGPEAPRGEFTLMWAAAESAAWQPASRRYAPRRRER